MTGHTLSFRGPILLGLLALLGLLVGIGLWCVLARLEGALILSGQIMVEDDRQIIQHPDGGVVAEVFVQEGSLVVAGDPLLRLAAPELWSQQRIVESRLATLSARAARLTAERDGADELTFPASLRARAATDPDTLAELDGQKRLFDLRLMLLHEAEDLLSERIDQYRVQGKAIAAEHVALSDELVLIEEGLADQETLLSKGLVPQTQILAQRREAARLQGQIAELAVADAQTAGQITEAQLRIGGLRTERYESAAAELREIEPQVSELTETQATLSARIDRLIIRAPVAGIVLGMQAVKPETVLQPAAPILSLVPVDRPLVITARLPPEAIDAVFLGQAAELAVSAFAPDTAPRLHGKVTRIAADAVTDPETGTSFYTLELALNPGERDRPDGRILRPGMRVEAFLATGSRSPLAYLLRPITRFFDHALRES